MTMVIHLRASISKKRPYGAAQARIFLEQLLPLVPDTNVQIAHLAGTGPGYDDPPSDEVMAVLAEAVARHDPRTRHLWFDVATCVDKNISAANAALVAKRIRQVGVKRILYGSDAAAGDNLRPPSVTPGLLLYIMVDSVAQTIEDVVAQGGEIVQPIGADAPEITARFRDPGGNVIGLYQQPDRTS